MQQTEVAAEEIERFERQAKKRAEWQSWPKVIRRPPKALELSRECEPRGYSSGETKMRSEQKSDVKNLQERMKRVGRGAQSPKPANDKVSQAAGTKNTIRLDHSRLLKIETDNSIIEQVTLADVITARTHSNEREECLFKRPKVETQARGGQTYNIHTLQFSVQNVKDLRLLTDAVSRMKQKE